MTSTIAALRAEIEDMKSNHSSYIEETMKTQGSLYETIRILREEKTCLQNGVQSLKEDKAELATQVGQLNDEIVRLNSRVPPERKSKDEPDVRPQTPVRRGFIRRIADMIEDKLITQQDETEVGLYIKLCL